MSIDNKTESYLMLLKAHPIFQHCSQDELLAVFNAMTTRHYVPGECIVEQGATIDSILFIAHGEAEVIQVSDSDPSQSRSLATLKAGDAIGLSEEGYFSLSGNRKATVTALNEVKTLYLNLDQIQSLQKNFPGVLKSMCSESDALQRIILLRQFEDFSHVSTHELRQLADMSQEIKLKKEEQIIHEGSPSDACYFIVRGLVEVKSEDQKSDELTRGQLFGAVDIYFNQPKTISARTITSCTLLLLDPEHLSSILKKG